jgi:hypothetical protein
MDVMGLTSMQGLNSRSLYPPHTLNAHVYNNFENPLRDRDDSGAALFILSGRNF